uniref:dolichyl-phosphate-mannose--protein mannosyltransferase n=2 Tax=Brugia malayi TaxID=6279 RepID=A0A8L7T4E6_BRUMA
MKWKSSSRKLQQFGQRLTVTRQYDELAAYFHLTIITVAAILSFSGNINGNFVFDDREAIINNKAIRQIGKILESDFWGYPIRSTRSHKSYRPVTTITFAINYAISGLHTTTYHIVNITLHAIICVLLYKILINLSKIFYEKYPNRIAFHVSLLFAIHPIHSEAVASIVGRSELLMTLFTLTALHLYIKCWCKSEFSMKSKFTIVSLSAIALFSKEQGIVVMPLCATFDICASNISPIRFFIAFRKRMNSDGSNNEIDKSTAHIIQQYCDCIRRVMICSMICIALLLFRFSINGFQSPQFSPNDNLIASCPSVFLRLINYCYIYMLYIWLQLYPFHLCFDYSMGCVTLIESINDHRFLISTIFIIGVIIFIIQLIRGYFEKQLRIFSIVFYIITFLPASNIFVTVGFVLAERVLYLPSVAFCLITVCAYEKTEEVMIRNKSANILKSVTTIIFIMFFIKSYKRSLEWRNELDLYKSGLKVCPNNAKIHYNIAKIMADNGDISRATVNYANAIRLNPTYENAMNNLANIYLKYDRNLEAEQLLRKAIKIRPNFAAAWMNLGLAQLAQKRYKDAENSFEQALSLRFPYPDCLYNMGLLYLQQNQKTYAREIWQNITRANPSHKQAWLNLLVLLDETNNCAEVISLADKVLKYHSKDASILSQLGTCYGKLGQYDSAEKFLLSAVELEPTAITYWKNIGTLYHRWNKFEKAKFAYLKAFQFQQQSENVQRHRNKLTTK